MIFVALTVEGFVEIRRLLPGAEDDLDIPTAAVEFPDFPGLQHFHWDVRHDEVPLKAQTLGFAQSVSFFFGPFRRFAKVLFRDCGGGSDGDKTGRVGFASELHLEIEGVPLTGGQVLIEAPSFFVGDDEIGGNAAQPVSQFCIDDGEFTEAEVAPIPQDEVSLFDGVDEVFAEIPVLFGGSMESAHDGSPVDEIYGEVNFHSGGDAVAIAMGGEEFVIAFGQLLVG